MSKVCFDNDLYIKLQSERILKRIDEFDNKLYLEFGGKLFDDFHASRVLPGFDPNVKIKLLQVLKDKLEMVFVISAPAIVRNKMRADTGITYGNDVLRLMSEMRKRGIYVSSIVITQYEDQPAADAYIKKLEMMGEKVYVHNLTKGYPSNINVIVSKEGYGANAYIETTRPLVIVTAPGPASGKLGTCLCQLYHEYQRGVKAGYAKFETFPVWNLSLQHPVNIAYEVATVDLKDSNMVDSLHLDSYGDMSVNYNRDVEVFPVAKDILEKIIDNPDIYMSPTDMGVNAVGFAITDDQAVCEASYQEVVRRYYKARCEYKLGTASREAPLRIEEFMAELEITVDKRAVVKPALEKAKACNVPAVALMLEDGRIITGKQNELMDASASVILNSLKALCGISNDTLLISPKALEPIIKLKTDALKVNNILLNLSEILIALSASAMSSEDAQLALSMMSKLRGCEAHSTLMLIKEDEDIFRRLGINLTCEPEFAEKNFFI